MKVALFKAPFALLVDSHNHHKKVFLHELR